jgi:CRISPR-associated protein Csm1
MANGTVTPEKTHPIALRVFQDALVSFANWAGAKLAHHPVEINADGIAAIATARNLVNWREESAIGALKVVFDAIRIQTGTNKEHFWSPWAIENTEDSDDPLKQYPEIPYPSQQQPSEAQLQALKQKVSTALEFLSSNDWQQLPILMLFLEKYGSYVSFGDPDIALFDQVKTTAAIAASLGNAPTTDQICLIAGDLSGIQDFIYTISSDGALKSLRARSFTLELVTEEIVQQLLTRLNLPRSNVIYAGGGNLYLLAPAGAHTKEQVEAIRSDTNQWLLEEFQSKVFLGLTSHEFPKIDVGQKAFADHWEKAIQQLAIQKNRKFEQQLSDVLAIKPAHEPCKVCHRDDTTDLKPLKDSGSEACPTCRQMFDLGQKLFNVGAFVRSRQPSKTEALDSIEIKIGEQPIYYHLFQGAKTIPKEPESVYLINNWDLDLYKFAHFKNPTPLLLGNYGQESQQNPGSFMTAQEMAEDQSTGVKRVGYLRMDVDRLGQIFADGLKEYYTLPRLSGLSRQMSYFFKVYLNSLAQFRERDFLAHAEHQSFKSLTERSRRDLLFIYAGGDDLFVCGAWDQVTEFAFDVYQSFRAFTGWHPDITLSAGISLSGAKYPLYQSAEDSGKAESNAKSNGRDSLGLFEEVFKWDEWLGAANQNAYAIATIPQALKDYIQDNTTLALFGIFPFVYHLSDTLGTQYSRSFVRNLLTTAQLQEQWIEKAKKEQPDQEKAMRYFLHLPRVAYTLARFPVAVKNTEGFDAVRTSLKSPYNAPYFRAIATWLDLLNRSSS